MYWLICILLCRGYYRCSCVNGCPARKHVERALDDPTMLVVTYEGEHCHSQTATVLEPITAATGLTFTFQSTWVGRDPDYSQQILFSRTPPFAYTGNQRLRYENLISPTLQSWLCRCYCQKEEESNVESETERSPAKGLRVNLTKTRGYKWKFWLILGIIFYYLVLLIIAIFFFFSFFFCFDCNGWKQDLILWLRSRLVPTQEIDVWQKVREHLGLPS